MPKTALLVMLSLAVAGAQRTRNALNHLSLANVKTMPGTLFATTAIVASMVALLPEECF